MIVMHDNETFFKCSIEFRGDCDSAPEGSSMMMREEIEADIHDAVLCWCATTSPAGDPNVSPKEIFAPFGEDGLVIADIASPITVRNLRAGSALCVSLIDIFRQKGWKLEGPGRLIAKDHTDFKEYAAELAAMAGPRFPIRHVIHMRITRHTRIIAPSYRYNPELSQEERIAIAMHRYGVRAHSDE